MAVMTEIQPEIETPYFQVCDHDLNIRVKIVAIGQPSEAVTLFCSRRGGGVSKALDEVLVNRAYHILGLISEMYDSEHFKLIPQHTLQSVGLKICPAYRYYPLERQKHAGETVSGPDEVSLEIFDTVRDALATLAGHQEEVSMPFFRTAPHVSKPMDVDIEVRNELARILVSAQQIDYKIDNILRIMSNGRAH